MAFQEFLDGAQRVFGPALEDQRGGHAQNQAFVVRIELGGLAVGLVGELVFVRQLVMDADRIERVGLRGLLPVGGQGRGRNKPSVQQGRRAWQRAATGRDAEEDEAERKPPVAKAMHGAPEAGHDPLISSCDGPRADVYGVCAWPSSSGVSF